MTLPIEQHWQEQTTPVPTCDQWGCTYYESNIHYIANPIWWTGILPGFGPGVLQGRQSGSDAGYSAQGCSNPIFYYTLTRLTFTGPDGTEMELRDQLTGGQPIHGGGSPGCYGGPSRGRVFVTADGSSATFVSDADISDDKQPHQPDVLYPSGYLMLRDGTRYRISNGLTTWIRDPNGNQVNFSYSGSQITSIDDSLNRHITITYGNPTVISFKGARGIVRTIKVYSASLSSVLRKHPDGSTEYIIETFAQLFGLPNSQYYQTGTFDIGVTSAVELPDGRQYQFRYDSYANLAQVILPTGGRIEYDWTTSAYPFGDHVYGMVQRVLERRTALDATTSNYETRTTYSNPLNGSLNFVTVDQLDPKNGNALISRTKHYFYGPFLSNPATSSLYPAWQDGREYQTEFFAADGATVLRRVNQTFQQRAVIPWWTGTADQAPPNDPRLVETSTTLVDTNQVSKTSAINPNTGAIGFDQYNNQTDVWEYDYGSGGAGSLIRHTQTSYLTSGYDTLIPNSSSPNLSLTYHIRSLPFQVSIYDAGGTERARTTLEYDNYATDSFHAALLDRSNISGHDSTVSTSYMNRGNATAVSNYLLPAGTTITSYNQFDVAGNVVKAIDPRGNVTRFWFTNSTGTQDDGTPDNFGSPDGNAQSSTWPQELSSASQYAYALPFRVTNALGHSAFRQTDFYTGQAVDVEDANGIVTSGYYDDLLDRPTQIRRAVGTSLENQTTFSYDDTSRIITTTRDRDGNNDNILVSKILYDQLGRTTETRQYEGSSNYIAVTTQYDALGRPYKISNPFRPWKTGSEIEPEIWTTQAFDALGRVKSVTTPDSAVVSTSYSGNAVTVTDQMGRKRKSVTDALGRLVQVYEDPDSLNYLTSYAYDVLDDLTSVTQGTQHRFFMYDSLKRLIRSRNPEQNVRTPELDLSDAVTGNSQWSMAYVYDDDGNLSQKTDARGVVSTYIYDALNRNKSISYSNDPSGTLPVTRVYDAATLGKGRLYQSQTTGTGGSLSTTDAYDALGRPTNLRQQFFVNGAWSTSYTTSRTYNLAGGVIRQTYPSSNFVTYNYDAAGRLADKDSQNVAFTGNLGDGATTPRTYSAGILYSSLGGLVKEQFGTTPNPIYNKLFYNSRGQLAEILESTSYTDPTDITWDRGKIINNYSDNCPGKCGGDHSTTAMTDNNGNLHKQEVDIPNGDQPPTSMQRWQEYHYDALNRLDWAREVYNSTEQWKQGFTYDRYGNRTINTSVTYGSGINNKLFTVDTSTNRLGVPNGQTGTMIYDSAGNLKTDTYSGVGDRVYDSENHMTQAWGGNNQWQYYTYDANGQRVRRKVEGIETWAIYGLDGEMVAEYAASAAITSPQKEYGYRNGQLLVTAEPPPTFNGYLNRRTITIDHTKVPNTDQSNFPVLISGTYSYLATTSNGGNVQNANGYDVIFTSDSGCATKLNHEVETYNATTGSVNYWVKGPTVSHSTDTVIYMCYGNASITTDQSNKTGVWDSNFKGVWHLSDNAANTVVSDSPGANNGTNQANTSSKTTNGKTAKALTYNSSSDYTDIATNVGNYTLSDSFTVEAWVNPALDSANRAIFGNAYALAGYLLRVTTANKVRFVVCTNGSNWAGRDSSTLTAGWHHVVGEWNGTTTHVYIDGALDDAAAVSGGTVTTITTTAHTRIGATPESGYQSYFNGTLDEVRSSKIARSADWIKTEYNNQSSPTSFYSVSAVSGGATLHWLVSDQLGTPRMIFDQTGDLANVKRHDYLPFGEEIAVGISGRTSENGYGAGDGVRQKFTSKERDVETGLDYFLARYYASTQGRFVSPDSFSGITTNPQTVNRYAYVANNPLKYVDPSGHFQEKPICDEVCRQSRKAAEDARKQAEKEGTPVTTITKNQKKNEPVAPPDPKEVFESNIQELKRMQSHGDGHEGDRSALGLSIMMSYRGFYQQPPMFIVPAYAQGEADIKTNEMGGVAIQATITSWGHFYISPGVYTGSPGASLSLGWLMHNTPENVDQFVRGNSTSETVIVPCEAETGLYLGIGGGYTVSSGQFSPQALVGTGGATITQTNGIHVKKLW